MKYLKRFNESSEDDWDLEEISDIFQDILDEGFRVEDVHIGSSLSIAPKLWCNSHHDFTGKSFNSIQNLEKKAFEFFNSPNIIAMVKKAIKLPQQPMQENQMQVDGLVKN